MFLPVSLGLPVMLEMQPLNTATKHILITILLIILSPNAVIERRVNQPLVHEYRSNDLLCAGHDRLLVGALARSYQLINLCQG
jgi:hypothetical protein